ncbi:MAG: Gx transporter family protein [Fibrobacter sp.]|jgi:heptaprenyl diphosphate synthase|nr:Gx transporter family protein [Fibrobacter sp.]
MQSHDERNLFSIKTIWLLLAISLNALELFLPRIPFLPWLKPGLANCITVVWIIRFGVKDAILFTLLRSWISGFYFGFSLLTLSLSLSGGIVATAAMGMAWNVLGKRGLLGTIGLSITGAFFHNSAQLLVVYFLLTHNASVFYQLPFMGAASIVFGTFAGLIVPPVWNILNRMELPEVTRNFSTGRNSLTVKNAIICSLVLLFCFSLFAINNILVISTIAVIFTIMITLIRRSWKMITYPLKFWPLFLFILSMYLFFSYGKRLPVVSFLTYEGLNMAGLQILRVWIWIEAGFLLTQFRFHETFFSVLGVLFRNHYATLIAGILALESFPDLLSFAKSKESIAGLNFLRAPSEAITEYLQRVQSSISDKWKDGVKANSGSEESPLEAPPAEEERKKGGYVSR